jgi:hypothetical protein
MDEKVEGITISDEAARLTADVSVHLSATSDQQEARIDQVGRRRREGLGGELREEERERGGEGKGWGVG